MKKFFLALSLVCLSGLQGHLVPQPCQLALEGEFLYWRNFSEQTSAYRVGLGGDTYVFLTDQPDYRAAYRINGYYGFSRDTYLEARFCHFNHNFTNTLFPTTTAGVATIPSFDGFLFTGGVVAFDYQTRYYSGDLALNHILYHTPCIQFTVFEGAHYFWSQGFRQSIGSSAGTLETPEEILDLENQTWGVGLEVGGDIRFVPFRKFSSLGFVANAKGLLLLGRQEGRWTRFLADAATPLTYFLTPEITRVIPGFNFRAGLDLERHWRCFKFHAELGYEWLWYSKAIIQFTSAASAGSFYPGFFDLGFHGPYASLGASF